MAYRDAATHEVGCWCNRNRVSSDVHPMLEALLSNVGEVGENVVPLAVADVQQHVGIVVHQHLVLDGPGNNVSGRQLQPVIIL